MRGIVRAADRVALWHLGVSIPGDPTFGKTPKKMPTSTPPQGAQAKPAVAIPNTNKFKTPVNNLKNTLSALMQSKELDPKTELKHWFDSHKSFHPYLKPQYAPAIKQVLGKDLYQHLLTNMPEAHYTALNTHQQLPAPNSNKFKTPANGLKKLLADPNTTPEHVQQWIGKHPSFHNYLGPQYADALKGVLGKDYDSWKEHLAPGAPVTTVNPKTNPITVDYDQTLNPKKVEPAPLGPIQHMPPTPSGASGTTFTFAPGTGTGGSGSSYTYTQPGFHPGFHPPKAKATDADEIGKIKQEQAKPKDEVEPADLGYGDEAYHAPDDQDEIGKVKQELQGNPWGPAPPAKPHGPHHNQYTDASELEKNKVHPQQAPGQQPTEEDKINHLFDVEHGLVADDKPAGDQQQQALAAGIKKIFPDTPLPVDQLSTPELKGHLENWQKHLPETPELKGHLDQVNALHAQHFGPQAGAQPEQPAPEAAPQPAAQPAQPAAFDAPTVTKELVQALGSMYGPDNINAGGTKLKNMSPEQMKETLEDWLSPETQEAGGSLAHHKDEIQAVYDKYFGQGQQPGSDDDEISAIKGEQPTQSFAEMAADAYPMAFGNSKSQADLDSWPPEKQEQYLKGWMSQKTIDPQVKEKLQAYYDQHFGDQGAQQMQTISPHYDTLLTHAEHSELPMFQSPAFKEWFAKQDILKQKAFAKDPSGAVGYFQQDTQQPEGGDQDEISQIKQQQEPAKAMSLDDWNKITPGYTLWYGGSMEGKSPDEQKAALQAIIEKYQDNPHSPLAVGAQKALDQWFGGGQQAPAAGPVTAEQIKQELLNYPNSTWHPESSGFKDLKAAKTPEELATILKGWASNKGMGATAESAQAAYDKLFGNQAQQQPATPTNIKPLNAVKKNIPPAMLAPDGSLSQEALDYLKDSWGYDPTLMHQVVGDGGVTWGKDDWDLVFAEGGKEDTKYNFAAWLGQHGKSAPQQQGSPTQGLGDALAQAYPDLSQTIIDKYNDPANLAEAKASIPKLISSDAWGEEVTPKLQQVYNKYFGDGAVEAGEPGPQTWDPTQFAKEYKEILPSSGSSLAGGSVDSEYAKNKLQGLIDSFPDTPETVKLQSLMDKWFGGGAGQPPAAQAPASTFDKSALLADMDKKGWSPGSLGYAKVQGMDNPEDIKIYLKNLASQSLAGSSVSKSVGEMLSKHFSGGTGAPPQAEVIDKTKIPSKEYLQGAGLSEHELSKVTNSKNPALFWENYKYIKEKMQVKGEGNTGFPEWEKVVKYIDSGGAPTGGSTDDDDLAAIKAEQAKLGPAEPIKPFKSQKANAADVTKWATNKPTTAYGWKNFATWWGNTKLTPKQEQGLYKSWFNKDAPPEQANQWFNGIFQQQSVPSEGDLGADTAPPWTHSDWAFGKDADKQWPLFQQWASNEPGLAGASVKQKFNVWQGLGPAEKAEIKADYLPDKAVDTKSVLTALQKAYPDSDWSKWSKMSQGQLDKNLKNLAEAGYKPIIGIYNKSFGGTIPMPEETEEGDEGGIKVHHTPQLPEIDPDTVPKWAKNYWGYTPNALKKYAQFMDFAKKMGQTDYVESQKDDYYGPKELKQTWHQLPDHLKYQLSTMGNYPFHDMEGFKQWVAAQPTVQSTINPIIGPDKQKQLENTSYYWGNKSYDKPTYLKEPVEDLIESETDPAKKKALIDTYYQFYGAGKKTLGETLNSIGPPPAYLKAKNWDAWLQSHTPQDVTKMLKKQIKTEPDANKWVGYADALYQHFSTPSGMKGLTNYLGKGSYGKGINVNALKALHAWKKDHNADPDWYPGMQTDDYDAGPYVAAKKAEGGYTGTQYPKYYGWTPPGGGSNYTLDPALFGSTSNRSYTIPPPEQKSQSYSTLLKKVDSFAPHVFSDADKKLLNSDVFGNWFSAATPDYQKVMQDHPGLALDDFSHFMGGGETYSPVPQGQKGKDTWYDTTPFANVPTQSKAPPGYPKNLQHVKRKDDSIKFPAYQDPQETIPLPPGQHWAPQYAPMPIYRIVPNDILNLDAEPRLFGDTSKMSQQDKQHFLQQQRWRLRQIDQIVNGGMKRDPQKDMNALNDWAKANKIGDKERQEIADQVFAVQPTLTQDSQWKYFQDFAKKNNLTEMAMYDLASKLGVGNPGQGVPGQKGNYEDPRLAKLVLDYIEGAGGIGTHWTRDIDKLYNGIPSAGVGPNQMKATDRSMPVLVSGLWAGQGETPTTQGGAFEPMNNSEREQNLLPGAPVHVRRVQIRDPDGDWHDLMDYGPISTWPPGRDETASGKTVHDKPSLAEALSKDVGGKFDPNEWDTLTPGPQTDQKFAQLIHDHPEAEQRILHWWTRFFQGRPDLDLKPHMRRANLQRITPDREPRERRGRILTHTEMRR